VNKARSPAALLAVVLSTLLLTGPAHAEVVFVDGFEGAETVQDLLQPGRWSYIQQEGVGTIVEPSAEQVRSGTRSLRCFGPRSTKRTLTKSDIATNAFMFRVGQTFEVKAWFYVQQAPDLNDLFLIDAECGNCGVQSPGLRVMVIDGYPVIERGELLLPTVSQTKATIPLRRWFSIRLRLHLGLAVLGRMTLWVDGMKVIDRAGTTVFPLGGFVNNIQVGLTANASDADAELFVDDVTIREVGSSAPLGRNY
jgi:hypothetical protein